MLKKILQNLGFNENEASVYLRLLQMNKASASRLGKQVGLERNMTRYTCQALAKKGLVKEYQTRNTYYYAAEKPEKLLHLIEAQKAKLTDQQGQIYQFIGLIETMQNPVLMCPTVEYYEGKAGIMKVYEDILETGEDVFCWTNMQQKFELLGDEFVEKYIPRRIEKNITIHVITEKNPENMKIAKEFKSKKKFCEMGRYTYTPDCSFT